MVVTGRENPPSISELLSLLGCLVSGLVMARAIISEEEFLDSKDNVEPASMSIACSEE